MKKHLLTFALLLFSLVLNAQTASKLLPVQNVPLDISAANYAFTIPPNDNRILVAKMDSLKLKTFNILGINDTIKNIGNSRYYLLTNPNGYISSVPAQSFASLTGKPTTLSGYGITDAYPLTGNPSNFLTIAPVTTVFGRAGAVVSANGDYNTSQVTESVNLYYTAARFNTAFSGKSTTDLVEGANLYFTTSRSRLSISAGNELSYDSATGIMRKTKRTEPYSGTTNGSGVYAVTFSVAYSVAPNIQANIIGGTNTNIIKITSVTTTGFTVTVVNRVDVLGLLPTYSNVSGANVDVAIFEK